jgi:hypothetical protein
MVTLVGSGLWSATASWVAPPAKVARTITSTKTARNFIIVGIFLFIFKDSSILANKKRYERDCS